MTKPTGSTAPGSPGLQLGLIRRDSPLPLYVQIRDRIVEAIGTGDLPPGAQVPSEPELVAAYGVGRPTVRQALALLRREGWVVTRHGRGTFVATDRANVSLLDTDGLVSSASGRDLVLRDELIDSGAMAHPPLEVLTVDGGGPWWAVTRLRHLRRDGIEAPLCARTDAFSVPLVPDAEARFAASGSTDAAAGDLDIASSRVATRAVAVPTAWKHSLGAPAGTPLLAVEKVDRTVTGAVCHVATVLLRTDLVPLVYEVTDPARHL